MAPSLTTSELILSGRAVLLCGKPFQALLSLLLTLLGWAPGVIHALFVVDNHYGEQRNERLIQAVERNLYFAAQGVFANPTRLAIALGGGWLASRATGDLTFVVHPAQSGAGRVRSDQRRDARRQRGVPCVRLSPDAGW